MSYHEYKRSQEMNGMDFPFYGLIMAAMRQADSFNLIKLQQSFPETWNELQNRHNAPGGKLEGEK